MKTADEILHEHGIAPPSPGKRRYYTTCPQCSANRSPRAPEGRVSRCHRQGRRRDVGMQSLPLDRRRLL